MEATLEGKTVLLKLDAADMGFLSVIRQLPYRQFDPTRNGWHIDHVAENWAVARSLGLPLDHLPEPTRRASQVDATKSGKQLALSVPPTKENIERCRGIPDTRSWSRSTNTWLVKPTRRNVSYIKHVWADLPWTHEAEELVKQTEAPFVQSKAELEALIERATRDYKFKTNPYQHQLAAFALGRDAVSFAYFMEPGTGKTKVTIDNAGFLFVNDKIDAMLVVCPKSIKSVWAAEVDKHLPDDIRRRVLVWRTGVTTHADIDALMPAGEHANDVLKVFIINVDALSMDRGLKACEYFLAKYRALMGVDESTRIKSPSAKRTKACIKAGKHAVYRRILTGTPVTNGPLDAFAQFQFLDPNILGFGSFQAFRNHFTIMGGWQNKQVLKYVNTTELQDLITPYSYRVTKDECLDLPEKLYRRVEVDLTAEQRRVYDALVNDMEAEIEGVGTVTATIALTLLLRLQQVTGGFLPVMPALSDEYGELGAKMVVASTKNTPTPGGNPKIEALLDLVEDTPGKCIVWARFRPELDLIAKSLAEKYGEDAVAQFHGGVKDHDRPTIVANFQDPSHPLRFFVGQTETGGIGLTLTAARDVFYYSNSFSYESRLQSEDRAHRIGQTAHVTYTDITARKTIDDKLLSVLRKKHSLANLITGDNWKEWL